MESSNQKQQKLIFPTNLEHRRLGVTKIKGLRIVPARRETKIFGRESPLGKIFFVLYIFISALLAFFAFSHASPPASRGARPISLGNAYTAVAGEGYDLFYNPGGLAEIKQSEMIMDYGRSHSVGEFPRSDFNAIYSMPYRWKDKSVPLAVGVYGEQPAPGASIVDITAGGGMDAPVDQWTKGILRFPVRLGAAATIRRQYGEKNSDRVGKSHLGLGLTGGAFIPINQRHQVGIAIRDLFPGEANPDGPSIHVGVVRQHSELLHMFADLEYGSGGIWRFGPGLEWLLCRGVLRPRLGWGFHDTGGIDTVSTGVGFYVSPFQMDIAYLIPTKTLSDETDQFRATLTYRFGRPQFSEIYYDKPLDQAIQLDSQVMTLTTK